ncbi:glycosyltransferase family 39 protein [Candidatus Woesearchaeota archaeon]|nr:glycosyltransferase family 39 protein [Candidatus Woesearchaeota archaeon]
MMFFISDIHYIGGAEDAGYSLIAWQLSEGKGFQTTTVLYFYTIYPSVTHPDDTSPPLYPLLLALLYKIIGISVLISKIPNLALQFIILPLIVYSLGKYWYSKRVGFIAALLTMYSPLAIPVSLHVEAEPLYTTFTLLTALFFTKSIKKPKFTIIVGILLAFTILTKYTGILLILSIITIYAWGSFTQRIQPTRYLLFATIIFLIITLPWFVRNIDLYGDPIFSVNKYNAVVLAQGGRTGAMYWNTTLPSYKEYIQQKPILEITQLVLNKFKAYIIALFPLHILAIFGLFITRGASKWFIGTLYVYNSIFHTTYWVFEYGYMMPLAPLLTLVSIHAIFNISSFYQPRIRPKIEIPIILLLYGAILFLYIFTAIKFSSITTGYYENPGYPYENTPETESALRAAEWASSNLPSDAIIITKRPRGFSYHSKLQTIYNNENITDILAISSQYNAKYVQCPSQPSKEFMQIYSYNSYSLCIINTLKN